MGMLEVSDHTPRRVQGISDAQTFAGHLKLLDKALIDCQQ